MTKIKVYQPIKLGGRLIKQVWWKGERKEAQSRQRLKQRNTEEPMLSGEN